MEEHIITEMTPYDGKRIRVSLDNDRCFILYKGEVRRLALEEGCPIGAEAYIEVTEEILPKRARSRALHLLERKTYSERKLLEKLIAGGYEEEVARSAVEYAKSFHYVDDEAMAQNYVEAMAGRLSRQAIRQKLLNRGIGRDLIDRAIREYTEEGESFDEGGLIRSLMEKKHFIPAEAEAGDRRRMYAFLARRGFSAEDIQREMK